jgi:hypothetical protein
MVESSATPHEGRYGAEDEVAEENGGKGKGVRETQKLAVESIGDEPVDEKTIEEEERGVVDQAPAPAG